MWAAHEGCLPGDVGSVPRVPICALYPLFTNALTMPQVSFSPTSKQNVHVRHHHHKYSFDKSDYVGYWQILKKNKAFKEPYAKDDNLWGHQRFSSMEYKPDPHYRQKAWWKEPGIRPWEHDELLYHSRPGRGPGLNPWILSTSANAPFATFNNERFQEETNPMVLPPWEKDEHTHMKSRGFTLGHVDAELLKKVHKLPWELDDGANSNPKESRTFDLKYPDNKWNESPWNRKPGANTFRPMTPPPPRPKIIREAMSCAAPFATKDNMVIVKYGEGKPSPFNNILRRRQRAPKPFVETHWPFERDEYDPAGKLPRRPKIFPRDINTYKPWPIPHAEEQKLIDDLPIHCDLKEGHQVLRRDVGFYPGDPTKKPAAGDVERVVHPRKLISYPRDPATLNPFPYGTLRETFHFADEPADKNQKHCDQKQGHSNGWQFYPGDPSKMPAAGQKPPPKLLPPTWDVNAAYRFY